MSFSDARNGGGHAGADQATVSQQSAQPGPIHLCLFSFTCPEPIQALKKGSQHFLNKSTLEVTIYSVKILATTKNISEEMLLVVSTY